MIWDSWDAFWSMGGRGVFVWGSYGALALAILIELITLKRARTQACLNLNIQDDQ